MPAPRVSLPFSAPRSDNDALHEVAAFRNRMSLRRTVREFSPRPVPRRVIEEAIRAAASAPSGANRQPWFFAAVEGAELKRRIREAAEAEERAFYDSRANDEWLSALEPFGLDWRKPFLEEAPWLIVVFQQNYELLTDGSRRKNYYIQESVGIASGLLLAALHHAGLATLTHTPSPMGFLRSVLKRPSNERAVMIVVTGQPAEGATVPDIARKPFDAVAAFY